MSAIRTMSDIDYLRAKINCAVSQIQARGLTIANDNGYGVYEGPNGLWEANKGGKIWPTAALLLGRPYKRYNEYTMIREAFGLPDDYITWFDNGFSGYEYSETHIP